MYFGAKCLLGLLALSHAEEDKEAVHLLQTAASKLSLHSDKECKAAQKANRDAKKKMKTGKAAVKAARIALKAARQSLVEFTEAHGTTQAAEEAACPVPEVDQSPDVGCSDTVITSFAPGKHHVRISQPLLQRGLPNGGGDYFFGFKKLVPGGGVPEASDEQRQIGISVMQPCSVAWTVGSVYIPAGTSDEGVNAYTKQRIFHQKKDLKTAQECRDWADTMAKWPEAIAVSYYAPDMRGYTTGNKCRVYLKSLRDVEWIKNGFELSMTRSMNRDFACFLGNPDAWKQELAAEKADGKVIDKCSKTSLWSFGKTALQEYWQGAFSQSGPTFINQVYVGQLKSPDPSGGSERGRKICLKWVKSNPKCAEALFVHLEQSSGMCYCSLSAPFQSDAIGRPMRRVPTEDNPSNGWTHTTCIL